MVVRGFRSFTFSEVHHVDTMSAADRGTLGCMAGDHQGLSALDVWCPEKGGKVHFFPPAGR